MLDRRRRDLLCAWDKAHKVPVSDTRETLSHTFTSPCLACCLFGRDLQPLVHKVKSDRVFIVDCDCRHFCMMPARCCSSLCNDRLPRLRQLPKGGASALSACTLSILQPKELCKSIMKVNS